MRNYLLLLLFSITIGFRSFATTTFTVGASGADYQKIGTAYAACTGSDDYVIEILGNYVYASSGETGGITLGALSNKNSINTVTIRPASGVTLSFSSSATAIFTLNGANWVIFDGRAGGSGASAWTMINTITNARRVFTLQGNACNNVFKYCNIQGNNNVLTQNNGGLIYFSKTNTSGNNNNTITDCVFTNYSSCRSYIYSRSDNVATGNVNNTVTNCQFIGTNAYSIWLETSTSGWTISNNHFYQTSSQTLAGVKIKQIYMNALAGTNFTITGNYIGGQAPYCGGAPFTIDILAEVGAIIFESSTAGGTNVISNNTIANLNITTTTPQINIDGYAVCAIQTAGASDFIVNGNRIGDTIGTGSITVACDDYIMNAPSFVAINANGGGTISISDNTVGAVDYTTSYANNGDGVSLLNIYATGAVSVTNNTFGNSTPNNITVNSNTNSLRGINHNNTDTIPASFIMDNNIVQNLTVNNVSGGIYTTMMGMFLNHTPTSLSNNVVQKITSNVDTLYDYSYFVPSITGIYIIDNSGFSYNSVIYNNKILDLITTTNHPNTIVTIKGMNVALNILGKVKIYRNKLKGFKNSSTASSGSSIIGLDLNYYGTDTMHVYNNLLLQDDASNTYTKTFKGIQVNYSTITEIYHNTVKLNATYSSGSDTSATLSMKVRTGTHFVKNNIFQNKTTGGSGEHYAQIWDTTYTTTANIRNNYNEAPNSSKLVRWYGVDKSLSAWRSTIGDGSHTEVSGTISISSSSGNPSSSDVVGSAGTPITTVTDDYDLNSRSALAPWIGAFELITALPIELLDISAKCQKSKTNNSEYGATIKWTTAMEINSDYFIVEGSKDGFVWEVKDTLDGAGTLFQPTNYYYHDDFINPTPENETVVYYRVSQTNFDGETKTFDIQSCKCEASDKIKIHPIPSNESIVINFGDQNNVPNSFQIMDMFGRIIQDITVIGDKANNTSYTLDISNYSSGRYIIKINDWKMKEDAIFIKQ